MSILRLVLGVVLLLLSTFAAKFYANKFKDKYEYYLSLIAMLNAVNSELVYTKRLLKDAVNVEYQSNEFAKTVNSIFETKTQYFPRFISINEKEKLVTTFDSLGKGDVNAQKLLVNAYLSEYSVIVNDLYEDYKKKYSTSIKVGFLLGVVLMVVVI